MNIECQITFILGPEGFAQGKLNRLKVLAGYFRSVVVLKNISICRESSAEKILTMISLGCKPNQLCQLWIEGPDAELACMVLTDFITEQFIIVSASHRRNQWLQQSAIASHPAFQPSFPLHYHYLLGEHSEIPDKMALISRISHFFDRDKISGIYQSVCEREAVSSTYIHYGIAFPHVITSQVDIPSLCAVRLKHPIAWDLGRGGHVNFVLAALLPSSPERHVIRAFTCLSRILLNDFFCRTLLVQEAEVLQAILFHTLRTGGCTE